MSVQMSGVSETKGEVVYGKLKDQVRPTYIPFSKNSGNKPVIATEQFVTKAIGESTNTKKVFKGSVGEETRAVFECQLFDNVVLRFARDISKIGVYIYGINGGEDEFSLNYIRTSDGFVTVSHLDNTLLKDIVVLDVDCLQNSESNISMNIYNGSLDRFCDIKAIVANGAKIVVVSMS